MKISSKIMLEFTNRRDLEIRKVKTKNGLNNFYFTNISPFNRQKIFYQERI